MLLFRRRDGRAWRRSSWADAWHRAVRQAGVPAGTGFHDLRHYYAALLIRRGASVKTVQNRLGHKSAVTTLDLYGSLWPDAEEQTRRAVDDEFGALPRDFSRDSGSFAGR
jgi:integrase